MKFGPVPLPESTGKILGHNLAGPDGRRLFRKGRPLTSEDVLKLEQAGRTVVYVAELEPGDVEENDAAQRLAQAVAGRGLRLSRPSAGRVNLLSTVLGVLQVDVARLAQINLLPGITLATLPIHHPVRPKQIAATAKIIPYAISGAHLARIEDEIAAGQPLISVNELPPHRVGIFLSGPHSVRNDLQDQFEAPLRARVEAYGSQVERVSFIILEEEDDEIALAHLLQESLAQGLDLVILAGETAIMDSCDLAPRAVERAGGRVECVGVPVDPGNLLMLAYLGDVPILGAPGCARSLKTNALDWVLPRLLSGERLTHSDLANLGHGGLLEDTTKRPMPRNRLV
jgi:molybdenum cofactor cytidylyltransferase